jgi:HEAT repeat protein
VVLGTLIAAGSCAFLVFVVVRALAPRPGIAGFHSGGMDSRLDALESAVEALAGRVDRSGRAAPFEPLRGHDGAEPDAGDDDDGPPSVELSESLERRLARIEERLEAVEVRLRAQADDPVLRGFTYLDSSSSRLRREGINLLRRFARSDQQSLNAIRGMLSDSDPEVRESAIDALEDVDDRDSAPQILSLLGDESGNVREEALRALPELFERNRDGERPSQAEIAAITPAILDRIGDSEEDVRRAAIEALGDLRAPGVVPDLVHALEDPSERVREEAVDALMSVGDPAARPHLEQLYEGAAGGGRGVSLAIALRRLGNEEPFSQEAQRLAEQVTASADEGSRLSAVRTLGRHAAANHREVLTRALQDESRRVRTEAQRALRRLERQSAARP